MDDALGHYRTLQVDPEAEPEVIEAAYRRLCRKYHPDVNPGPDAERRIKAINAAYEVLDNPRLRAEYDRAQGRQSARRPWPETPPNPPSPRPQPESTRRVLPRLALSRSRLELDGPGRASFEVFNLAEGQLIGTVSTASAWLRVTPTSFTANRILVNVEAIGDGYPSGRDREGYVFVATNGGTAALTVHVFGENAAAGLEVAPRSLLIGSAPGGFSSSAWLTIGNRGRAPLSGTIRSTCDWLSFSPASFSGAGARIRVGADFSRLLPGLDHYTSLLIESNGGAATIPVQAFICAEHATVAV